MDRRFLMFGPPDALELHLPESLILLGGAFRGQIPIASGYLGWRITEPTSHS